MNSYFTTALFRPLKFGSSINDVTHIWTIFDTPLPTVTPFSTKALVLSSQNPWTLPYIPSRNFVLHVKKVFMRKKKVVTTGVNLFSKATIKAEKGFFHVIKHWISICVRIISGQWHFMFIFWSKISFFDLIYFQTSFKLKCKTFHVKLMTGIYQWFIITIKT